MNEFLFGTAWVAWIGGVAAILAGAVLLSKGTTGQAPTATIQRYWTRYGWLLRSSIEKIVYVMLGAAVLGTWLIHPGFGIMIGLYSGAFGAMTYYLVQTIREVTNGADKTGMLVMGGMLLIGGLAATLYAVISVSTTIASLSTYNP